ncbi:hypothetical protein M128_3666 [Bacteroides fragilis str. S6L8]|uniref:Uncharacterized protein n=2 Tax=Bacteroides fragilis TaxID=817 RepID=A0A015SSF5_BACFG|nr:hypothetical protein M124_3036 [Bacteroides fragilis str. 3988T(B)14]EXZ18151.1 hypothetical protein M067_3533 [Bacteroides fragilis str. J-143-4]EXZ47629.1 hypothetical protein M109_3436 [Bacteroides fragilis str. 3397 N2]EXZ77272.1 hypothetical protein M144_3499 [Bacteroides fragilis str. 3-F-2 \
MIMRFNKGYHLPANVGIKVRNRSLSDINSIKLITKSHKKMKMYPVFCALIAYL